MGKSLYLYPHLKKKKKHTEKNLWMALYDWVYEIYEPKASVCISNFYSVNRVNKSE